jgi:hypothetical protein
MIFLNSSSRVEKMLSVKNSSPRVNYLALGEEFFTESFFLRRELFFLLSAKSSSPRAQDLALTKAFYSWRRLCSRSVGGLAASHVRMKVVRILPICPSDRKGRTLKW